MIHFPDLLSGGKSVVEGGGAAGGRAQFQSVAVVLFGLIPGDEAGDHGIAAAHVVDGLALGNALRVDRAGLIHQRGALAAAGDEDVDGAHLLQFAGILFNEVHVRGFDIVIEEFGDLVMVRLDEEGLVRQDLQEAFAGGVHDELDAAAVKALQDALVDVLGTAAGHGAG